MMTESSANENRTKPPDAIPLFRGLAGKSRAETATLAEIHQLLTADSEPERHAATLRGCWPTATKTPMTPPGAIPPTSYTPEPPRTEPATKTFLTQAISW